MEDFDNVSHTEHGDEVQRNDTKTDQSGVPHDDVDFQPQESDDGSSDLKPKDKETDEDNWQEVPLKFAGNCTDCAIESAQSSHSETINEVGNSDDRDREDHANDSHVSYREGVETETCSDQTICAADVKTRDCRLTRAASVTVLVNREFANSKQRSSSWSPDMTQAWRADGSAESGESADDDEEPLTATVRECQICYNDFDLNDSSIEPRAPRCCKFPVCEQCFSRYTTNSVLEGKAAIQCPSTTCRSFINGKEILHFLPTVELKQKFHRLHLNGPTVKTCPRCTGELRVEASLKKKKKVHKKGLRVVCQSCCLECCFTCHAPWHEGLTCKEFRNKDRRVFLKWTQENDPLKEDQINAQKCPICKTYFQRTFGCSSMTCNRCGADFCYNCGELSIENSPQRLRRVVQFFMGDHSSRLSPRGCRRNLLPNSNVGRKCIRGSVFGAKVVCSLALSGCVLALGAGAAALLLGVGPVALPVYGGIKVVRSLRNRREARRARKSELAQNAETMDPVPEPLLV